MRLQAGGVTRRIARMIFILFWFVGLPGRAPGQDLTVTFTGPSEPVPSGSRAALWLNVLNPSGREVSWAFPQKIQGCIVSPQGASEFWLELRHPAEAGELKIAPGAFVRREYLLPVPETVTGQVVVVFPQLSANRVVLDTTAPPPVAGETEQKGESAFNRLVKHVEPLEPGKPFDAGRFFKEHISGYEPFYFIAGTKSPNAKFQISFMYQLLNNEGPLATKVPALKGFNVAYTQTSLWDWNAPSAPFFDTSYKPEFLYAWNRVAGGQPPDWYQLDLQGGLKHESNGKDGANSRSMNTAYLRPTLTLGRDDGLQLTLQPRAWVYLGDLSDNPDIADYRGYADSRAIVGWKRGLQFSALGRMGEDANHGSLQLDLTYPMMRIFGSFSLYLQAQYFTGYGESLLEYNQRSEAFRVGFSLYR
ncbi:MAG: phospholipase A [Verrucomicrobiota bacterium]|jgi:outer membrane phospholipase A